tara:strand:- start:4906 stop:5145 length:240 start_codon:yes stop_codon:yes gene_type:complete
MTVAINNPEGLPGKLKSILDTAKLRQETAVVIMTDRAWHMEVFDFMVAHQSIGRIKMAGSTYFIIKDMRIELKPIDFYI